MKSQQTEAKSIFLNAVEIDSPVQRQVYLDAACAGDEPLRREVEDLLRHCEQKGAFLESPIPALAAIIDEPLTEQPGTVIGPYKLLEEIGEGGFGVVYMAEQQHPVRRKVALKVVKPGMDTKQVVARFEAERQALAMMDHPNIAHVLDAGATDSGRPYFVMDLIRGMPITEFCDGNQLTPRERLQLFVTVCQALQHAHQKGIIHRDLKPSNVLVTLNDGTPLVKVIDFGIAKALGQERLTDKTLCTGFAQMIGTPLYMSPEQAEMSGQDADTRTDIYSLGVLLYELLTGTTPFGKERLKEASYDEIRRIIREEEPAKPSTRISTLGQAAITVSANRKSEPRRLSQLFRGEMDWIVMKALEKDRNRRYDTASNLAADVQRYLDDEPVEACPPTLAQRVGKWSRRHRGIVRTGFIVLSIALVSLLVCTLLILSAYQREAKERQSGVTALYRSKVQEARAIRRARSDGYRTKAWKLLREALTLETPENDVNQLRQEAVGCMGDFVGLDPITWDGFSAEINAIALHPKGTMLAVGLSDGTVVLQDLDTGKEWACLDKYSSPVAALAFAPDGLRLISGDRDGRIRIYETKGSGEWALARMITAEPTLTALIPATAFPFFLPHLVFPTLNSVAITPDGKQLAGSLFTYLAGSHFLFSSIALWNLADGTRTCSFEIGRVLEWISCPAFSPDGKQLAACYLRYVGQRLSLQTQQGILLWDLDKRGDPRDLSPDLGAVHKASFSPDGKLLACACNEGLAVFDTIKFQCQPFPCAERSHSVAFSPDGHLLAIANPLLGQVRLWNVTSKGEVAVLRHPGGANDFVKSVACSSTALVAASHRTVRMWNLAGTGERLLLAGHGKGTVCLAFSADGKLASAGVDRAVKIWDSATGQLLKQLPLFGAQVETVAFSADGKMLATGDWSGAVQIWDVASWRNLATVSDHGLGRTIWSVAFSPNGRYFAACGRNPSWLDASQGGLALWRTGSSGADDEASAVLKLQPIPGPIVAGASCVAFSPDSQLLAWAGKDNAVHLWDLEESGERPFPTVRLANNWKCLAFLSGVKQQLVFVSDTGEAEAWDVATGCQAFAFGGQQSTERAEGARLECIIALSSDGAKLAGICGRNVTIWETARGELSLRLPEVQGLIYSLAWSPNRERLAVGTSDGGLAIWDLAKIKVQLDEIGLGW
jgi:WD40 repeat protein/serine/threonine protein kinase